MGQYFQYIKDSKHYWPDEVQLGRQLEGVERLLEEDGVEDLEGAAAGQRQQHEVEAGRLAGQLALGGGRVELLAAPHEVEEQRDEVLVRDALVDERRPVAGPKIQS